jgi:hypothetical protein
MLYLHFPDRDAIFCSQIVFNTTPSITLYGNSGLSACMKTCTATTATMCMHVAKAAIMHEMKHHIKCFHCFLLTIGGREEFCPKVDQKFEYKTAEHQCANYSKMRIALNEDSVHAHMLTKISWAIVKCSLVKFA